VEFNELGGTRVSGSPIIRVMKNVIDSTKSLEEEQKAVGESSL